MIWLNSIKAKWTILGILFGGLFPLIGTLLQIRLLNMTVSLESILLVQLGERILWIVDLAPLVLGFVFSIVGNREHELRETNKLLVSTNQELSELHSHLEQKVGKRTAELLRINEQATRRADQLSTIAELAYSLATVTEIDFLLQQTTKLVSQRMGYYHVGIFLLDDAKEYAILIATNSDGGGKMLARNHRLRVGSEGIVGYVASRGKPRIALDVGADAVYFKNPDLLDTRSEVALPLLYGGNIIGVLDIQSTQPQGFTNEDLPVFTILANQIVIAIQNARYLEQAKSAMAEAEAINRQLVIQNWSEFKKFRSIVGYRFDGARGKPLTHLPKHEQEGSQNSVASVPILLRGEVIGKLLIKPAFGGQELSEDETVIIQATADQLALALESARLLDESQRRASKEQTIGEISSKISSAINLENILQTALREMGRILPGAEISIQVENDSKMERV